MTPTDAQIEAVRKILYEWFATSIEMDNSDWDSAAEEAITALDIENIEQKAYERGMNDVITIIREEIYAVNVTEILEDIDYAYR